jgi:4-amino-4-deoxy-L-arabinose transferase-like glycosyltransferase
MIETGNSVPRGITPLLQAWATWVGKHRLDLILAAGLFLLAAAVRLPYLQLIPQLTDETGDVLWALDIYRGWHLPLTQNDPYNGPVLGYLLAAAFWLFGVRVELPRLVMLLLGSLTVVLTYALARVESWKLEVGSWKFEQPPTSNLQSLTSGLIAAGLMTTAFVPVVINSHIAWSNCSTPFFVTLALLALALADRRQSGPWLALAGLLLGVAVQTHPSALVVIPGLVVWFLSGKHRRAWLRTPWPYLAVALALLAYSNIIWYNLQTGFGSIAGAQKRTYALVSNLSLRDYAANVGRLLLAVVRMVGSAYPKESQLAARLELSALFIYGALLVAALVQDARRGSGLALAVLASTALFMPVFNKFYGPALMSRYIAYLLPLCSVAMGGLLAGWLRTRWLLVLLSLLLIGYPALVLRDHYTQESAKGGTNAVILRLAEYLHQAQEVDGAPVYLDRGLRERPLRAGGHVLKGLDYLLTLKGTAHDSRRLDDLEADLAAKSRAWLVLTDGGYARLKERYDLLPVDFGLPPSAALPGGFRLYGLGDVYVPRRFAPPSDMQFPMDAHLGEHATFLGYRLNTTTLKPGQTLELTLYWQASERMDVDYTIFVHVIDGQGRIQGQHDGHPMDGRRPTTGWVAGEVIADEHIIPLKADVTPGQYRIEVGMYHWATGERLPVYDAHGQRIPGDQIVLPTEVEVQ